MFKSGDSRAVWTWVWTWKYLKWALHYLHDIIYRKRCGPDRSFRSCFCSWKHCVPSNQPNELRTDIPFIIQFNPHNPPINAILKKNKHILTSSGDTKYMSNYHFQMVHRRALNLKQSLVRADLKLIDIPKGSGPCGKPCVTCPYMERTTTIFCSSSQETFPIHGRFNCKTKNVIYVITCTKCGLQYVGQSSNTFNERFRNHLSDIRQENADKPVSRHFSTNSHNVKDVSAIIVTSTNGNINVRLRTEEAWIARLQSRMPNGLNLIQ